MPGGVYSVGHPTDRSSSLGTTKNAFGTGDVTVWRVYANRVSPTFSPARTTSAIAGIHANIVGTPPSTALAVRVIPGSTAPCAARRLLGLDAGDSATSLDSRAACATTASTAR